MPSLRWEILSPSFFSSSSSCIDPLCERIIVLWMAQIRIASERKHLPGPLCLRFREEEVMDEEEEVEEVEEVKGVEEE